MCRRNQLWGVALMAFGIGLLMASLFESTFFCGCVGAVAVAVGVGVLQKK